MDPSFQDKKLQKLYEDIDMLRKKYGDIQAKKIVQRINELYAADHLYDVSKLPQARLHSLQGKLKGLYAVDLKHPYRLILQPLNGDTSDLKSITKILICNIIDYH